MSDRTESQHRKEAAMEKIKMTTPLVEMDGDEMTRILWKMIKDELLYPFIDLKTEYYDLGLEPVSYTHLDVYKRQVYGQLLRSQDHGDHGRKCSEYGSVCKMDQADRKPLQRRDVFLSDRERVKPQSKRIKRVQLCVSG